MTIWIVSLILCIIAALFNLFRLIINHDVFKKPWQAGISTFVAGLCAIIMVMSIDQYYRAEEFVNQYDRAKLSAYWVDSIDPDYEQIIYQNVADTNIQLKEYQKHPYTPWYPYRLRHLKPITLKVMDASAP